MKAATARFVAGSAWLGACILLLLLLGGCQKEKEAKILPLVSTAPSSPVGVSAIDRVLPSGMVLCNPDPTLASTGYPTANPCVAARLGEISPSGKYRCVHRWPEEWEPEAVGIFWARIGEKPASACNPTVANACTYTDGYQCQCRWDGTKRTYPCAWGSTVRREVP